MLKAWVNDPRVVAKFPFASMFLLEGANADQIWKMWHVHSALGQNFWGWFQVQIALWLWLQFYRVVVTENRTAFWATAIGIGINGLVCLSVLYFQHFR